MSGIYFANKIRLKEKRSTHGVPQLEALVNVVQIFLTAVHGNRQELTAKFWKLFHIHLLLYFCKTQNA